MPKRSLDRGKNNPRAAEQLNTAIEAMFAHADGKPAKLDRDLQPLLQVAADLRSMPRENFKARLRAELLGGKTMATVAEPVTTVHAKAAPRIAFKDPARAIEFYKQALGARELFRFEAGGSIAHAELAIGDSTIMIAGEWPEGGRFSAETLGNSPITMSLEVPDVDSFASKAEAAGMKMLHPPKDEFYGRRDATLVDPFGYMWSFYTVKERMSLEEMHRRFEALHHGPEGGEIAPGGAKVKPVREGFRMVTPYLVAPDGHGLIDFVKQAFGAEELLRVETPIGGVHGEVRIGDSIMMLGGAVAGKKFPASFHAGALHIYVEDADAATRNALAAGATLVDEVRDQDYGERSSTVKDAAGNYWYIATARGESHVPSGLHVVNPYLHPRRAEPLIAFLKRAFGAHEVAKYASPDGVVHHAVIRVGDSVLEMGEAHGKYEPIPAMFYLYVPDVDAAYRRAVAAGATSFQEPTDQFYGDRSAGVRDDFGNVWYIATHIRDVAL